MDIGEKKQCHPPKTFTREKMEMILKDISEGSTRKHAAEANGISERHFYYAIKQGIYDLEQGEYTIYCELVQRLRKIEQEEIKLCRNNIRDRIKSHKGAEWTLERVYYSWFGSSAQVMEMDERLRLLEQGDKRNERNEEKAKETTDA